MSMLEFQVHASEKPCHFGPYNADNILPWATTGWERVAERREGWAIVLFTFCLLFFLKRHERMFDGCYADYRLFGYIAEIIGHKDTRWTFI